MVLVVVSEMFMFWIFGCVVFDIVWVFVGYFDVVIIFCLEIVDFDFGVILVMEFGVLIGDFFGNLLVGNVW